MIVLPDSRGTAWLAIPIGAVIVLFVSGLSLAIASRTRSTATSSRRRGAAAAAVLPYPGSSTASTTSGGRDAPVANRPYPLGHSADAGVECFRTPLFYGDARGPRPLYLLVERRVALVSVCSSSLGRRPDRGRSLTAIRPSKSPRRLVGGEPEVLTARSVEEGRAGAADDRTSGCAAQGPRGRASLPARRWRSPSRPRPSLRRARPGAGATRPVAASRPATRCATAAASPRLDESSSCAASAAVVAGSGPPWTRTASRALGDPGATSARARAGAADLGEPEPVLLDEVESEPYGPAGGAR